MTAALARPDGSPIRALVVDDEVMLADMLRMALRSEGWDTRVAHDGQTALKLARETPPDVVVLDIMMPGLDGLTVLRRLREAGNDCPVLLLTAKDAVEDRVAGLTAGGDDYVTKPFSLEEVMARLRGLVRRSLRGAGDEGPIVRVGDLTLDEESYEVERAGHPIALTPTEFEAAALFDAQPASRAEPRADPRPGLELRLRRSRGGRRAVHLVPAQEDRRPRPGDDPHRARSRLFDQAGRGGPVRKGGRVKRWSLSTRLTVGIVGLLAVLALAIGAVTVTAVRGQLVARLDNLLLAASERTANAVSGEAPMSGPAGIVAILPGQGAGAVGLVTDGTQTSAGYIGVTGEALSLEPAQIARLLHVPADRQPRTVDLGDLGSYRVVATPVFDTGVVVNGLSLAEADATTASLISTIAAVSLGAIALAVLLGSLVVRVTLRPLTRVVDTATRVSELPLESGEVSLGERVPDADTAPSTEVGRVGAALNRLLGKVETSLAARHESEQKLRRFVADASHELRTPLASIRGYAELGRRGKRLPADTARSLERIESESVRMSTLVDEMMLLARLDAGRDLRSEPVGLGALLVEAVSDAHAAGPDHHWNLELPDSDVEGSDGEGSDGEGPDGERPDGEGRDIEVRGDPDRLRQAIVNLLANARLHTPAGTNVTVALTSTADGAAITVTDDGPGIDPALQANLFERFTRGDDSRSRLAGSTGLGLAIVAAIVGAHGGTVTAASEPGHTVFRVELPAAPITSARAVAEVPTASGADPEVAHS